MHAMTQCFNSNLTFDNIMNNIRQAARNCKDRRRGDNVQYKMEDFVLSAFSVFYLQCPSFLAHQKIMDHRKGDNNARTLFGINKIPTDNQIRKMLDEEQPETLFPIFNAIFNDLRDEGILTQFQEPQHGLLIAFDGVDHHSSTSISCPYCKTRKHRSGDVTYSHGMVTAVLVKPGCSHVIDLPPEFITAQDGNEKQDCEIAAGKRWLERHANYYQAYNVTLLGDDLYSHQPFCEAVMKVKFHFIFVSKPDSHKTLYEHIEGLKKLNLINTVEIRRWTGRRHEIDHYSYVNQVPLRDGEDALNVNWCELMTRDEQGKVLYKNSFITDHIINHKTVLSIVSEGRARWKTENENNNTLKKQGYNLAHNFGHGKKNLSNVLATLNLLAFLLHTILEIMSSRYRTVREKLGARRTFFEHMRSLLHYMLFPSWDKMLLFIIEASELKIDTS